MVAVAHASWQSPGHCRRQTDVYRRELSWGWSRETPLLCSLANYISSEVRSTATKGKIDMVEPLTLDYDTCTFGQSAIIHADCFEWLSRLPANSLHAIVDRSALWHKRIR